MAFFFDAGACGGSFDGDAVWTADAVDGELDAELVVAELAEAGVDVLAAGDVALALEDAAGADAVLADAGEAVDALLALGDPEAFFGIFLPVFLATNFASDGNAMRRGVPHAPRLDKKRKPGFPRAASRSFPMRYRLTDPARQARKFAKHVSTRMGRCGQCCDEGMMVISYSADSSDHERSPGMASICRSCMHAGLAVLKHAETQARRGRR